MALYRDRTDAGKELAAKLSHYAGQPNLIVLALPRGGVPVAFEVAEALDAELDVFVVRKLGVPGQEELAMGAIASGGVRVVNEDVVRTLRLAEPIIAGVARREEGELERRERLYRGARPPLEVKGKTAILVDDGLATGSSMRAAIEALRARGPSRIVVAVPVAASSTCEDLKGEVDEILCALTPQPFNSVGQWYDDFSQTTDDEVRDLIKKSQERRAA